jgi:hypothetical protein
MPAAFSYAGTVHGTVKNGTTGKIAAGVQVILIQLQGGMQPVADTKSDGQGQFSFDNPLLGKQPMLVRAVYGEVNFHQPVPPGTTDVTVEVFDPSPDAKTISVVSHIVVLQPNGSTLTVGEEYSIKNESKPPVAYFRTDGNFEFALPEGTQLQQAAAWGPAGMPVVQATIDKSKNRYAVAYAFRPGENGVRYSYQLPYAGNTAALKLPTVYPGAKLLVVAPPGVQISGDGLQAGGQEQGMNVYGRDSVAAGTAYTIDVSGTASASNAGNGGGDAMAQGGDQPQVSVQQIPGRLDVLKWPLIAGFLGVFALGAILLARKPVTMQVAAGIPEPRGTRKNHDPAPHSAIQAATRATTAGVAAKSASQGLAEIDSAIGVSLDSLKDQIFRLELRRQAGTISEADYATERARAEEILRNLLRG